MRQGIVEELNGGNCFSYILEEGNSIQTTEYKVLQSQNSSVFVRCMRMRYNGKAMLFYLPDNNMKSLSSIWQVLNEETMVQMVEKIMYAVIQVRDNGFLDCGGLDISFNRIFVDKQSKNVSLVYLPMVQKDFDDYDAFERALRQQIAEALESVEGNTVAQLREKILDPMVAIDDISSDAESVGSEQNVKHAPQNKSEGNYHGIHENQPPVPQPAPTVHCTLISMNTPNRIDIAITKKSVTIGRHPQMSDVAIGVSSAIGRKHCRVDLIDGKYYITDLESKNFTYVNNQRLQPNEPFLLKNDDIVRLADVEFGVEME